MKKNIYKYLAGNDYPGRGIVLGQSPDGQKAFIAYWIMGRSANSRNRVFEPITGGIRTVAADPAKLEDPHLIIYNAVLTLRETTVVTNGDQTDTIAQFMNGNLFPGYSFEAALATRTYEDDAPNFTPRISGVVDMRRGGYKLSIVKSNEGNAASVQRQTFDYPQPVAGEGHFISTYVKNGAPIPSFAGVSPVTPYGGADPEWSKPLDELSGYDTPEDTSLSNGASIAFLFEFEKIRIAFLGDAYPSVCIDGLLKLGYSCKKPCCVDLVKLSHHGSKYNCSDKLFQILRTQNYLLSTDGRSGKLPNKTMIAKLLHSCDSATIYCNYSWWKKSIYSSFFTEEDREKWLVTGNLNLIELSSENTSETVKSGLELYGFGRGW